MSENYGFVYVLSNPSMPDIYKVGMTDRAPSQRVAELSKSTSVPTPFEIIVCSEVWDAQKVEARIHNHFIKQRVNSQREFFKLDLNALILLRDFLLNENKTGLWFEADFIEDKEYEEWMNQEKNDERIKITWFYQQNADPIDWNDFEDWMI